MGTNFYLQHREDETRQLHIAKRNGTRWTFQAVFPARVFAQHGRKDVSVYYFVEDFTDMLPKKVCAITSLRDWIDVLENLPENATVTDDNCSGETADELLEQLRDVQPRDLRAYIREFNYTDDPAMQSVLQSIARDEFVDAGGNLMSYRQFT